jgi:hypothetical protein
MRQLDKTELKQVSGAGKDGPGLEGQSKNGEPGTANTNRPGREGSR